MTSLNEAKDAFLTWLKNGSEDKEHKARFERVVQALVEFQVDLYDGMSANELREMLLNFDENGIAIKGWRKETSGELWQSCCEAWCVDSEEDWQDEEVRKPFLEWLREIRTAEEVK